MSAKQTREPEKIFLVRHGESEWNVDKRISGQLDPLLSQKGIRQSKNLAKILRDENLSAIYTSTLTRSIETARPIAACHGIGIQSVEALKEIHLGSLQGRYRDERDSQAQQLWAERKKDDFRAPGGETFTELEERVTRYLENILQFNPGGTILIVGHRSTNRVILAYLMHWTREIALGLTPRNHYLYEVFPGSKPRINTIRLDGNRMGTKYDGCKT